MKPVGRPKKVKIETKNVVNTKKLFPEILQEMDIELRKILKKYGYPEDLELTVQIGTKSDTEKLRKTDLILDIVASAFFIFFVTATGISYIFFK